VNTVLILVAVLFALLAGAAIAALVVFFVQLLRTVKQLDANIALRFDELAKGNAAAAKLYQEASEALGQRVEHVIKHTMEAMVHSLDQSTTATKELHSIGQAVMNDKALWTISKSLGKFVDALPEMLKGAYALHQTFSIFNEKAFHAKPANNQPAATPGVTATPVPPQDDSAFYGYSEEVAASNEVAEATKRRGFAVRESDFPFNPMEQAKGENV